jgi:putative acetyltransferase
MPGLPLIEVRPYRASDLDGVIDLFQRAVRETASADYNEAQIEAWAQADRDEWELARASRPTWIGLVDGELAGFADLEKNGLIDMMFVDPLHQR